MVNQELHSVEKRVVSLLENGEVISVESIGGFQSIKEGVSSLANSPVLPEIVQALAAVEDHSHNEIILSLVASCTNGIALRSCVNAIDSCISDGLQPLLFRVYIDQINTESLGPVGALEFLTVPYVLRCESRRCDMPLSPRYLTWTGAHRPHLLAGTQRSWGLQTHIGLMIHY